MVSTLEQRLRPIQLRALARRGCVVNGDDFEPEHLPAHVDAYLRALMRRVAPTPVAPTDIQIAWEDYGAPPGGQGSNGTYTTAIVPLPDGYNSIAFFTATDAQGDPSSAAVFTLVTPVTGLAFLDDFLAVTDDMVAGEHDFTIRATVPGGLYVDEQFTITVTA